MVPALNLDLAVKFSDCACLLLARCGLLFSRGFSTRKIVTPRKVECVFACRKNNQAALDRTPHAPNEAYGTSTVRKFPEINTSRAGKNYGQLQSVRDIFPPRGRSGTGFRAIGAWRCGHGNPQTEVCATKCSHGPFRIHHRTLPTICHILSFSTVTGL